MSGSLESRWNKERSIETQTKIQKDEFLKISDDYSGTFISDVMTQDQIDLIEEFGMITDVNKLPWTKIKLEVIRSRRVLNEFERKLGSEYPETVRVTKGGAGGTYTTTLSNRKIRKMKSEWLSIWEGEGLRVGYIEGPHPTNYPNEESLVYLCSDGLLRSTRTGLYFQENSRASGVGTVPQLNGCYFSEGTKDFYSGEDHHPSLSLESLLFRYLEQSRKQT